MRLAEVANGPIPLPLDAAWPWGDALDVLDAAAPQARVINLETAVTQCPDAMRGKPIHYRMNPANLPCLAAVRPDCCVLANNNHVQDFGRGGLAETMEALDGCGLQAAGAGRDADEAWRPAVIPTAS